MKAERRVASSTRSGSLFSGGLKRGALALFGICLAMTGCSPDGGSKIFLKDCILPDDQAGSLTGRWNTIPVPLAFQAGAFSDAELTEMVRAAGTWNEFSEASLNVKMLDFGDETAPNTSSSAKPGAICSQGILVGSAYSGSVVVYKQTAWPYDARAMAITSLCTVDGSPFKKSYMAVMEINFEDFFVAGKIEPDLQTIVSHELGHLMGLKHSCNIGEETGIPSCADDGLDPDYVSALMFPSFAADSSGRGEVKRSLGTNDQGRANCLYEELRQ